MGEPLSSALNYCTKCTLPSNTCFIGSTRLYIPNGISIGSAVFCMAHDRDRQTHSATTVYNQAQSEYKHALANILRSRYIARTPPLEARSPGRRSNVENARRHPLVTNQQHAHTPRKLGFALCCHSNATGAPIANPPNSAQPGRSLYHASMLHPDPCSSVGVRPRTDGQTDRHTHTQTRVTTIHFASSTTHAKCNNFL